MNDTVCSVCGRPYERGHHMTLEDEKNCPAKPRCKIVVCVRVVNPHNLGRVHFNDLPKETYAHCETHGIYSVNLPGGTDLCPIGKIEEATEIALARIAGVAKLGYVLVPVEITDAMKKALNSWAQCEGYIEEGYAAMLEAAQDRAP